MKKLILFLTFFSMHFSTFTVQHQQPAKKKQELLPRIICTIKSVAIVAAIGMLPMTIETCRQDYQRSSQYHISAYSQLKECREKNDATQDPRAREADQNECKMEYCKAITPERVITPLGVQTSRQFKRALSFCMKNFDDTDAKKN